MKSKKVCAVLSFGMLLIFTHPAAAQTVITWTGGDGDFFDPNNWDANQVPGAGEVALINNGRTATIAVNSGTNSLGSIRLGDGEGTDVSGHIVMNGGHLNIGATEADPKVLIGFSATLSTFIMNGGTIFFDGPELFPGEEGAAGLNELDWEVGEGGFGRFEMHNDAVFRAGDDLKIAENAAGHGSGVIDGNARVSVGSGISVSGGGESEEQTLVIGGNALVEAGNSMGAGSPEGFGEEGYLTMAFGGSSGRLTLQDNAVLNIRRLSAREGNSIITVRDNAQFHIFDVFRGRGMTDTNTPPDRPEETSANSTFASAAPSNGTLTLQDNAVMTVNSFEGLKISGPRDLNNTGGTAQFIIRDSGSFRVEQYLAIGTGRNPETSDGTLEVRGPNATVSIGTDLNLAVDPDGTISAWDADGNPSETPGKATLSAVITGSAHSPVNVAGTARINQGRLKVRLDGFQPGGGEVYTLIQGGTIDGQFRETDYTEAVLPAGLTWEVEYAANAVRLRVAGQSVAPTVSIRRDQGRLAIEFNGILQTAASVSGPWTDVPGNPASPFLIEAAAQAGAAFFRVRR